MRTRKLLLAAGAAAVAAMLAGCFPPKPIPGVDRGFILGRFADVRRAMPTSNFAVDMRFKVPRYWRLEERLDAELWTRDSDALRFSAEHAYAGGILMTVSKGRFGLWNHVQGTNELYEGRTKYAGGWARFWFRPENLTSAMGLAPADWIAGASIEKYPGCVVLAVSTARDGSFWTRERYRLEPDWRYAADPETGEKRWTAPPDSWRVVEYTTFLTDGTINWRVTLADHTRVSFVDGARVGWALVPQKLLVEWPAEPGAYAELRLKDGIFGEPYDNDEMFARPPAAGAKITDVDASAAVDGP